MSDNTIPTAEYKYDDAPGGGEAMVVSKLAKLEPYLVEYKDGQGHTQARVVFHMPGSEHVWIVQKTIQGANVVTAANDWFKKGFQKKLVGSKPAESI